jgi:hypothetical protein
VTEKRENVSNIKQFSVRPKKLYEALLWLKNNNKLYSNVDIVEREEKDYNVNDIIIENNVKEIEVLLDEKESFLPVLENYKIFKGKMF